MNIPKEIKSFIDEEGKLKIFPSKRKKKLQALIYLATKFEKDKIYTEKEVNNIINQFHCFNDACLLRRELYNNKFMGTPINSNI